MGDSYTILAFVGGGIRGLLSAAILKQLDDQSEGAVLSGTDLFAGTSTGSVIVSRLVARQDPTTIIQAYRTTMAGFYEKQDTNPLAPAYDIDEAYAGQYELTKEMRVSEVPEERGMDVLFTAFDVGDASVQDGHVVAQPWAPVIYTSLDVESPLVSTEDVLVAKASMASGTMPGQFGSLDRYVDGAFLNHDPTIPAIAMAVAQGYTLDQISAITIGTGLMHAWIASDTHEWGAEQWLNGDDNPFSYTPPFYINLDGPTPSLDMTLNGTSTSLMPNLAALLLGERYVNLNPPLPCFIPENSTSEEDLDLLEAAGTATDISAALELISSNWGVAA